MKKKKESKEHIPVRASYHETAHKGGKKLGIPMYQFTEQAIDFYFNSITGKPNFSNPHNSI